VDAYGVSLIGMVKAIVSREDFSINDLTSELIKKDDGAIVTFIGTVRNKNRDKEVVKIIYDAYEPMATMEIQKIIKRAMENYRIDDVIVYHKIGEFLPGEKVVFIGVSSAHREDGFKACKFIIDEIKKSVPIWKKEFYHDGSQWLEE